MSSQEQAKKAVILAAHLEEVQAIIDLIQKTNLYDVEIQVLGIRLRNHINEWLKKWYSYHVAEPETQTKYFEYAKLLENATRAIMQASPEVWAGIPQLLSDLEGIKQQLDAVNQVRILTTDQKADILERCNVFVATTKGYFRMQMTDEVLAHSLALSIEQNLEATDLPTHEIARKIGQYTFVEFFFERLGVNQEKDYATMFSNYFVREI